MKNINALISGGTSGIGKSMVCALAEKKATVGFIGTDRKKGEDLERTLRSLYPESDPQFHCLDLSDMKAINSFTESFRKSCSKLDILVNTAGVLLPERKESPSGLEKTFAVSYLGAFQLTNRLIPLMKQNHGARILNVSAAPSILNKASLNFEDLQSTQKYIGFQASTRAVLAKTIFTCEMAERLKGSGVCVHSFHPGNIRSGLFRNLSGFQKGLMSMAAFFFKEDSQSGINLCFSERAQQETGKLWVGDKAISLNYDPSLRNRLWEESERLIARELL